MSLEAKKPPAIKTYEIPHCFSASTFPELRPAILPNEPMADKLLKLLLPSLKFDFLDLLGFVGLDSTSVSLSVLILATFNWRMAPRQNGQTGPVVQPVAGSGFLRQHSARVQWAHIWWSQGLTSIVHTWSKHIQHNSILLSYTRKNNQHISNL